MEEVNNARDIENLSILYVEDEILIYRVNFNMLERRFEPIYGAIRGEEAVIKAIDKQPDIIIMDIKLPGEMSGIDAVEQIRETYNPRVIFCSAYENTKTLEKCLEAKKDSQFISKPLNFYNLKEAIKDPNYSRIEKLLNKKM